MEWEVLTGAIAAEHSNFLHRFWKGYRSTSKVLCLTQGSVWTGHSLVRSPLSVTMFPYRHKVLWSYKPWARTNIQTLSKNKVWAGSQHEEQNINSNMLWVPLYWMSNHAKSKLLSATLTCPGLLIKWRLNAGETGAVNSTDKISSLHLVATYFVWGSIFIVVIQFHLVLQGRLVAVIIGPG